METISDIVKNLMHSWESEKKNQNKYDFDFFLKKLLTKRELRHIKVNYFKRGILSVSVDSSVWLYQFSLKKNDVLSELRKNLSNIKDINLRLGKIR